MCICHNHTVTSVIGGQLHSDNDYAPDAYAVSCLWGTEHKCDLAVCREDILQRNARLRVPRAVMPPAFTQIEKSRSLHEIEAVAI